MRATDHIANARRAAAVALVLGAALAGCTSAIDHMPTSLGGLPEGVPQRPAAPPAYPHVHDLPAPRDEGPLTPAQRKQMQEDLAKTRDRYVPETSGSTAAGAPRNP